MSMTIAPPPATARQYRAFEDLEEPCSLAITPTGIIVTYQMKSIICEWAWASMKHLKTANLTSPPPLESSGPRKVDLKSNLLRIRFLPSGAPTPQPHIKLYRFESRPILDEFLAEAIRLKHLDRIVNRRLFRTKVKYVPVVVVAVESHGNGTAEEEEK